MKTKHEILTALAHSGAEKILLASLLDKEQTCDARGYLTSTRFLSMSERALCTEAVHQAGATGHAVFWGGYEDAEAFICSTRTTWMRKVRSCPHLWRCCGRTRAAATPSPTATIWGH